MKPKILAVDFDGTCVTHEFPKIGKEIGASQVLKAITDNGHKIILFTMRSNNVVTLETKEGKTYYGNPLQDAINWFKERDIPLFGINENPTQKNWTSSPKPYAHCYIDDAALGIPLITLEALTPDKIVKEDRPFVYWFAVIDYLVRDGFITWEQHFQLRKDLKPYILPRDPFSYGFIDSMDNGVKKSMIKALQESLYKDKNETMDK